MEHADGVVCRYYACGGGDAEPGAPESGYAGSIRLQLSALMAAGACVARITAILLCRRVCVSYTLSVCVWA